MKIRGKLAVATKEFRVATARANANGQRDARSTSSSVSVPVGAYRADIDGLRAIAVLLVLLFHGASTIFTSGFIGVDVFFVISGYLITTIVLKDLESDRFSFYGFYARRAWRLQPAMIAVFLATLLMAAVVYLPSDFIDYLKSTKYATLFLSNQYFARTTTAYDADDTSSLLLLHTWSLAIEWQWYFLLPACLVVLYKWVSRSTLSVIAPVVAILAAGAALVLSSSARKVCAKLFWKERRCIEMWGT